MQASLEMRGPLRLAAMRQAVRHVVARHEALRTTMSPQGEVQHIVASMEIDVAQMNFSHMSPPEREAAVEAWFTQIDAPIDLVHGPLLRVDILKREEDVHILTLTAHHIVVDGWSIDVILHELGAWYSALCRNTDCQLPPCLQLSQYISWQTQQSHTADMQRHETYWLDLTLGTHRCSQSLGRSFSSSDS